jgi:hypothetical protein
MGDEENHKYNVVERLPLIMFSVLMIIQLKIGFSPDSQQKGDSSVHAINHCTPLIVSE